MKFVIDATSLLLPSAGVKNYIHYWLLSLMEVSQGSGDEVSTYPPLVPVVGVPDHLHSAIGPAGTFWRLAMVHFSNMRKNPATSLLLSGKDLFHASQHTANAPAGVKLTATIFDMSCWVLPETHTPANVAATKAYADRILRSCDGLIAISGHTRDAAVEILGIPQERIRVIYPGVAEPFFTVTETEALAVRTRLDLRKSYILFVGCIEPRKNVGKLIAAYRQMPAPIRRDTELVIAGPMGWVRDEEKAALLHGEAGIRYLGYVPERDLPGLYRGAAALAYPSQYEGFGFPAAQALAAGVPVVASNRSCLPEVLGNAGLLVDSDSAEEIAHSLERVLTSSDLACELSNRGRERAAAYHWSVSARRSLELFREVVGK